ncbi:MAG: hypothetical protein AUJ98_06790 [Bacteroidetes bacterium CG2_30_33_31]|nr:MAG: hypothetical protein AUJ98_06790 [Bacteroidetes bacterium CG2_30_33_31]
MNKLFTLNFKKNESHFTPNISDDEMMFKSEKAIELGLKPSKNTIDFLLQYSKALEVKRNHFYLIN